MNAEYGYGLTLYGWEGERLAWESGTGEHGGRGRTTHYVYEPDSFVPMAQATHAGWILLHEQPEYDEHYDIDRDPLWSRTNQPATFTQIGYYQCDQIGTPQEVTDEAGEVAWSARYKAWGEAKEVISEAADLFPKNRNGEAWRFLENLKPWRAVGLHEEIEAHGRADCLRTEAGRAVTHPGNCRNPDT